MGFNSAFEGLRKKILFYELDKNNPEAARGTC
jgi:hypothetical protein